MERLGLEVQTVRKAFPFFQFFSEGEQLYVEGPVITRNQNLYTVRVYYPENYPYNHPTPIVLDKDVVMRCKINRKHILGEAPCGGVFLCVIKPTDEIGCGWTPDMSMLTILNLSAAWLHAYEVLQMTGKWILPEA